MPRRPRITSAGLVDHVLNRGVARLALFEKDEDSDGESTTDGSGMERRG